MGLTIKILLITYVVNFVIFLLNNIRWARRHPFFKHVMREYMVAMIIEAIIWPIMLPLQCHHLRKYGRLG